MQNGTFSLFLFDLLRHLKTGIVATLTKQKIDGDRKIAKTSCMSLYVKVKEIITNCYRTSSYDYIDFLTNSQEVLMYFWKIELEEKEEEKEKTTEAGAKHVQPSQHNVTILDVSCLKHNWCMLMQMLGPNFFAILDIQIKLTQHQLLLSQDRASGKMTLRDVELL